MAWGPADAVARKDSWKKEIRRGPRPGDAAPYTQDDLLRDRIVMNTFGTSIVFVGALAFIIVLALVFYAQYSGAVRWFLSILVLAVVAYAVARFVGTRARDPRPLVPGGVAERRASGALWTLATTLDRASGGLKYSQVMFSVRMKDAFLERVRISRGLTREDVDRARSGPQALMALIGDPELTVFVLESERNGRHWPALLRALPTRPGFRGDVDRILAKMEAWR